MSSPIEAWLEHLRVERGYGAQTLAAYGREISVLADPMQTPKALAQVSEADLRRAVA